MKWEAEAWWLHRHRQSIINSLQDTDISIRRRSLDLLFAMCNKGNVREIVAELLSYLQASILQATSNSFLYEGQEEADSCMSGENLKAVMMACHPALVCCSVAGSCW